MTYDDTDLYSDTINDDLGKYPWSKSLPYPVPKTITIKKALEAIHMCRELMLFDPLDGCTICYESLSEDDRDLYDALGVAIVLLCKEPFDDEYARHKSE